MALFSAEEGGGHLSDPLKPRLLWVMMLRVIIISALLGTTIVLNYRSEQIYDASPRYLFSVIVITYGFTVLYALWYRLARHLVLLGYLQFVVDTFVFGSLVYFTGGVSSGFTFLFHLWVIVAVISLGKRASYVQATISSVVLAVIAVAMALGMLRGLSDQFVPPVDLASSIYFLTVNVFSLFLVAALINVLMSRLEEAGAGLQAEIEKKEQLEQELEQTRHLAALGELAATLAHEIRNPLSAVSGSFQMLCAGLDSSETDRRLARIIERELGRIGRLVEDILEYTRPRDPVLAPVNLSRLCEDVASLFRNGANQVHLEEEYLERDVVCRGDRGLLHQLLWNLLVNAVHAVGENGKIRLRTGLASKEVAFIEVSDNGPGVPPEIREEIFDAFFSTRNRGMGLGLALCSRIAHDHGGELTLVNAEKGDPFGGAVFRLTLPLE